MNACIGLGQTLLKRGHEVIFVMNEALAGQFSKYGFGEIGLRKASASGEASQQNPVKMMAENILRSGRLSNMSSLEKFKRALSGRNILDTVCNTLIEFDAQIEQAITRERPDVIILAQFLVPPAIARAGVPWVYNYPLNPIGLYTSPKLPPFYSGKKRYILVGKAQN